MRSRWSKTETGKGALDFKDNYATAFYQASPEAIAAGKYDVSKLRVVLDALFAICCEMSAGMLQRGPR